MLSKLQAYIWAFFFVFTDNLSAQIIYMAKISAEKMFDGKGEN